MKPTPAIVLLTVVPTLLLSAVGILSLVFQTGGFDIVMGVLVLIFSIAALSGGLMAIGYQRRESRRRQLQTDFVSKVSHELRTPLASIRMFVETLERGDLQQAERRACVDAVSVETSRLSSMIERLLTWGRMEAGRAAYDLRPERADTLVAEALALMETQLAEAGIEVELELPDEVLAVRADRVALVDTLLNLMRNAVKYGGSGGVMVVRVREERGRVVFDVEDRGPGIATKEQRRVFEKFYRGSAAELRGVSGSGLGLAMARHVVRAHRGRIELQSRPGEGARFSLVLPSVPADGTLEVPAG